MIRPYVNFLLKHQQNQLRFVFVGYNFIIQFSYHLAHPMLKNGQHFHALASPIECVSGKNRQHGVLEPALEKPHPQPEWEMGNEILSIPASILVVCLVIQRTPVRNPPEAEFFPPRY
uniref:Uncharacterized protein n=1 Tax=Cacopsylla melanoneura TaxID=428564 RepID=A0A8D8TP45_9HEMI